MKIFDFTKGWLIDFSVFLYRYDQSNVNGFLNHLTIDGKQKKKSNLLVPGIFERILDKLYGS